MQQPQFGRLLRQMRKERGLSQAALAGDDMSTGYLSRLESGGRRPTRRVVDHLARRLEVDPAVFTEPGKRSLLRALTIAASADGTEFSEELNGMLETEIEDPALRWHGFFLLAQHHLRQGRREEARDCFGTAVRLADELDVPELRCRSHTQFARCLLSMGDLERALATAEQACRVTRNHTLPVSEVAAALLALVSAEAEAGRLPDARAHADELLEVVADRDGPLGAKARWASATVRVRQGDHEGAQRLLGEALEGLASSEDLLLWARLRLAAASLSLQSHPPLVDRAARLLAEADPAVRLIGTDVTRQELGTLQAHVAYHQGRFEDAREAVRAMRGEPLRTTHRDRIRLRMLEARLEIAAGERAEGCEQLRKLGEEAQREGAIDLAADAWRLLAESLDPGAGGRRAGPVH